MPWLSRTAIEGLRSRSRRTVPGEEPDALNRRTAQTGPRNVNRLAKPGLECCGGRSALGPVARILLLSCRDLRHVPKV